MLRDPLDLDDDELRFRPLIRKLRMHDRHAFFVLRPERLVFASLVVLDDLSRGFDDRLGRAIVLLELHDLRARILALEIHDVADVRATPLVNRLILVADDADILCPPFVGLAIIESRKYCARFVS